jgi:hypothetical protein
MKRTLALILVAASALAGSLLAASLLSDGEKENQQAEDCPDLVPAASRDNEAQWLTDSLKTITSAARDAVHEEVNLHSAVYFMDQQFWQMRFINDHGEPNATVTLNRDREITGQQDARGIARSAQPLEELVLTDLSLGAEAAIEAVTLQYPGVEVVGAGLGRKDCSLIWSVGVKIPQQGQEPRRTTGVVDATTGVVTVPTPGPTPAP